MPSGDCITLKLMQINTLQQMQHTCQKQVYRCLSFIKFSQRFNPCCSYFNYILAHLINWHLIWLSTEQLWKTLPSFTTIGKPQIITGNPCPQNPPVRHGKINSYIMGTTEPDMICFHCSRLTASLSILADSCSKWVGNWKLVKRDYRRGETSFFIQWDPCFQWWSCPDWKLWKWCTFSQRV